MQTPLSAPKPSKRGPPRSLAVVSETSAFAHPPIDIRRNAGSIGGGFAHFDILSDFVQGAPRGIRSRDPLFRVVASHALQIRIPRALDSWWAVVSVTRTGPPW